MKLFKDQPVDKIVRTYNYGEEKYCEILVDGETLFVREEEVLDSNEIVHTTPKQPKSVKEGPEDSEKVNKTQPETKDIKALENVNESQDEEEKKYVAIKDKEEIKFSRYDQIVSKKGWDLEAIDRVIEGKQKTHKGYAFKLN